MSTRDDIAQAYAKDCAAPVQLPAWATLPHHESATGKLTADGWGVLVVVEPQYTGPERRAVPRDPVLVAHGSRVLPRERGWLFAARAR
jgi:hypothetical protein